MGEGTSIGIYEVEPRLEQRPRTLQEQLSRVTQEQLPRTPKPRHEPRQSEVLYLSTIDISARNSETIALVFYALESAVTKKSQPQLKTTKHFAHSRYYNAGTFAQNITTKTLNRYI